MSQRPILDRLSAVARILPGLAVLLVPQAALAEEAPSPCPRPSGYQPTWQEPALKGAEAALLSIVLQDGQDTNVPPVLKLPGGLGSNPDKAPGVASEPPCKDARIVLSPDATVAWIPGGRKGTWCLKNGDGATWGDQLAAGVAAPDAAGPARKLSIRVGTTYSFGDFLADAPEIVVLYVFGVPPKDLADQAKKTAMAGLEKHLSDALVQEMLADWRKTLGDSAVYKRYRELAKPFLVPGYSAEQALAFIDARAALVEGIRSHFLRAAPARFTARLELHALWKQAASEALTVALQRVPDMPWVEPVNYSERLLDIERKPFDQEEDGALLKRRERAARALDALAIASSDSIPIPLFRGELPARAARVVLLSPATGRTAVDKTLVAPERVVVLSAGFLPSHGLAVAEGDVLKAASSELGQALGKMVAMIAGGLVTFGKNKNAKDAATCQLPACQSPYADDCCGLATTCAEPPPFAVPAAVGLSLVAAPEDADDSACCTGAIRKALHDGLAEQAATLGRTIIEKRPTTRVLSTRVEPGREHRFFVCSGAKCTKDTEDGQIVAEIKRPVRARHRLVSTATEVALGVNLSRGGTPLGGYRLKDVGGSFGPDKYRRLVKEENWSDLLTFSQLVVVYPFVYCGNRHLDGLALAAGPTFATGREAGIGSEWAFRAAYEPSVLPGVLFTAGFSVRMIKKPRDVAVGTTFAVPRTGTDPVFATENETGWLLSLGIAFDLSILADVAGDIAKAGKGD